MNQGKKITIYLASGLPKGVREVRIDQGIGKAVCGPRNAIKDIIALPEVQSGACVYFLVGTPDDGGLLNVYVDVADEYKTMFEEMWPKALQLLKELVEE